MTIPDPSWRNVLNAHDEGQIPEQYRARLYEPGYTASWEHDPEWRASVREGRIVRSEFGPQHIYDLNRPDIHIVGSVSVWFYSEHWPFDGYRYVLIWLEASAFDPDWDEAMRIAGRVLAERRRQTMKDSDLPLDAIES